MNILVDTLPDSLEVSGREYKIRTSFKDCLRVMLACEDNELTPQEKNAVLLANVYYKTPKDASGALKQALWFLDGGGDRGERGGTRLFSFTKDANLIYAAFRQTHNIDLSTADLHWWAFMALFSDLGADTAFCQLTALRSRIKKGRATKEERQAATEMGAVFDVPEIDNRDIEEKELEREFMKQVTHGR